jgi:hypothetical protein
MPTHEVETFSGLFSSITNLTGAGFPALMGRMPSTTGSYARGFLSSTAQP